MQSKDRRSTESLIKSKSGATSRSKAVDFSLVPTEVIEDIAARFQYGLDRGHNRNNWKIGKNDPDFIQERLNHAEKHLRRIQDRTGNLSDLQGVLCNLAMISWWLRNGNGAKEILPHLYTQDPKGENNG